MKSKKNVKDLASSLLDDLLGGQSSGEGVSSSAPPGAGNSEEPSAKGADSTLRLDAHQEGSDTSEVHSSPRPISPAETSRGADLTLLQSENMRLAQQKILDLEQEIDRVRRENEKLAAAAETIRRRSDELTADNEFKTKKVEDLKERLNSEKEILEESVKAKDREIKELRLSVSEYEMRLSTNLQKIRVRERELENRLELVKMENSAMSRNKDEIILDLKRRIDQLNLELENYRIKGQELNKHLNEKQDVLRRTVKALRLALSLLEGSQDDSGSNQKAS